MTKTTPNAVLAALQQELEEVLLRRARANRLQTLLQSTGNDLGRRETERAKLRKQLDRERADVESLEGLSFTAILWTALHRKEERLTKEQAELAAAQLRHDTAAAELHALQAEREQLSSELAGLADADSAYAELMERKEQLLLASGDERARRLLGMSERVCQLRAEIKELEEADRAGKSAERAVREVRQTLESAAGWGQWDLWGSGGAITSSIKHQHLDDANQATLAANAKLDRFRRELQDTELSVDSVARFELTEMDRFVDVFFDNFFTDWGIQTSINRSIEATEHTLARVIAALALLKKRRVEVRNELDAVEQDRTRFLEAGL